ncbi:MAG: hypothetical protein KJ077_08280 [Anaerolineae bacterium]|nr:hypothetical protein [Anaerolineae bacterium]
MDKLTKQFDNFLDAIQSIIMSFLVKLGPFFVALMPSLFTAYAIFHTFEEEAGWELALLFALVVGAAIETVGIVATHTCIDLYNGKEAGIIQPIKFKLMAWLVPVYVIGVAAVVGFSGDAFTPLVKSLGIASPFLTAIVYVAVALHRDIIRIMAQQSEADNRQATIETESQKRQEAAEVEQRQWQREKERLELELKHKERMARIEAKQNMATASRSIRSIHDLNAERQAEKERAMAEVLNFVAGNPLASLGEIGQAIGKSKSTAANYVDELAAGGRLYKNGSGWEVIR